MKFTFAAIALASLFLAPSTASGQFISIAYPADGAVVPANSQITVEINRPDFATSGREVALVLGLNPSCPNSQCVPPSQNMGDIMYDGPFTPQRVASLPQKGPHQNFTITVGGPGLVQLNAFHVGLLGVFNTPFTEYQNITLNVQ
ncbi:hypothetical protein CVT26_013916 [Gymnopilus dilepis]|uniref:Uncharacterized protein n=1 Tax=Gymnopilus dilepis TaxID=231916 RepID=A0A409VW43_9AGAR|nr:hypothetical protein CVT26_013916 [Gymnopilus dilepis]